MHLIGHSNGPLFAQYVLTHTSQQWKNKYIQGFTSLAGNLPGHGGLYQFFFTGLNIPTASFPSDPANAASSAAMYESLPAAYMSASNPAYFKDREVVVRVTGGKEYTPKDAMQLFKDAGLSLVLKIAPFYWGIVKSQPPYYPNVDTYAEIGSGLPTLAGIELPDLTVGQVLGENPAFIFLDGDSNQEYLTNESVKVWASMPCFRYEFNDNPGVDHMSLAGNPAILQRLLEHTQLAPSTCRRK